MREEKISEDRGRVIGGERGDGARSRRGREKLKVEEAQEEESTEEEWEHDGE